MDVDSVVKSERKIPQTIECLLTDKDILIKHGSQHEALQEQHSAIGRSHSPKCWKTNGTSLNFPAGMVCPSTAEVKAWKLDTWELHSIYYCSKTLKIWVSGIIAVTKPGFCIKCELSMWLDDSHFQSGCIFYKVPKAVANLLEHGVLICHCIIYQMFFVIILRLINHPTKFLHRHVISLNIKGLNQNIYVLPKKDVLSHGMNNYL